MKRNGATRITLTILVIAIVFTAVFFYITFFEQLPPTTSTTTTTTSSTVTTVTTTDTTSTATNRTTSTSITTSTSSSTNTTANTNTSTVIQPLSLEDNATAEGVNHDSGTPIGRTTSFSVTDRMVYSWLEFVNVKTPSHNITWVWLTPQKHLFYNYSYIIPDPGPNKCWPEFHLWCSIYITNSTPSCILGTWEIDVYINGTRLLVQEFNISDDTPPVQPTEGFTWPNYNLYVYIQQSAPSYARQNVIAAMKQWNFSQIWFQNTYELQSRPIFNLIVSDNPLTSNITVIFNQTQTNRYLGHANYQYWYSADGTLTKVTCSVSLDLSTSDGAKLNDIQLFNVATHELGHCLGLDHVQNLGDLMTPFGANGYDVRTPSSLNLYTLYQLSALKEISSINPYYYLPDTILYVYSPMD